MATVTRELVISPIRVAANALISTFHVLTKTPAFFIALLLVPTVATISLYMVLGLSVADMMLPISTGSTVALSVFVILGAIISLLAASVAGVVISRFIILDDVNWPRAALSFAVLRYAGWTVGLFVAAIAAFALLAMLAAIHQALGLVLLIVAGLGATFVWVRWSLLFPAIALDAPTSLGTSWDQTRGCFWRIFFSGLLATLGWFVAFVVIYVTALSALAGIGSEPALSIATWIALLLNALFGMIATMIPIAVSAWLYRSLPLRSVVTVETGPD